MPMSTDRRMQYMQPADLKPAPDNPRKHSAEQIQKLAKSMKAFGVVAPVIVDSQGQLIAGHARREAALVAGIDRMPVILADDLTAAQVKAYRIADNKLTEGSSWDEKLLAANLADLSKMQLDFELEDIGFVPAEIDVMTLDLETEVSTDKADEYSIRAAAFPRPVTCGCWGNTKSTAATPLIQRLMKPF